MRKKWGIIILAIIIGFIYASRGAPPAPPPIILITPTPNLADLEILLTTGQYQAAIEWLEQFAVMYPQAVQPFIQIGQIYLHQHRWLMAADAFNRALARDSGNVVALAGSAEVELQQGQTALAVITWQQAAELDPIYYTGLGRAYLAQLDFEAAHHAFSQSHNDEATWYLAALAAPSDPEQAETYLKTITNTHLVARRDYLTQTITPFTQNSTRLAKTVGIALSQLEEWPLAIHALQIAHEPNSQDGEILAFLAQAQAKIGRPAFDLFEQATQVAPNSVLVLTLYGQYLRQQGALKTAQTRFEQAATLDPENAAIFAEIAMTKNELGHLDAAEQWYQVAIQVAQDKTAFQLLLAKFYVERNYQLKEAGLPLIESLLKLHPDNPTMHDLYGWMLFLTGQPQEAEAALQKSLSLKPDFIQARYHLARVLMVNGKPLDAATAYQAVIDGDTQGGWRDLAQQAMKNKK